MAEDFEQTRLGWFNSGLQLANQYGEGVRLSLAKQQQKSAEAERAARERELNARISQIDLKNRELTAEIQRKAAEDAELLNTFTGIDKAKTAWEAQKAEGNAGLDPDWQQITLQQLAPLANRNEKARGILKDLATIEATRSLAQQRGTSPEEAALLAARTRQAEEAADLSQARAKETGAGRSFTKPELEKIFSAAETEGQPFTPEQKRQAREVHLGLRAKEGTEPAVPPEGVWIARNFQDFMATRPRRTVKGKTEYLSDDEAVEVLRDRYKKIMGGGRAASVTPAQPSASAPVQEVIRVTKEGKRAIFDAATKKFLRYAD